MAERDPSVDYDAVQTFGPAVGNVAQAEAFAVALSHAGLVVVVVLVLGVAAAVFLPRDFSLSPQQPDSAKTPNISR